MLETVENVRWSELTHAYGIATDVPNMLRDLVSANEIRRENAFYDGLHGAIVHQYTLYPATPHVIPFLIEMLRNPEVLNKPVITATLGNGLLAFLRLCAECGDRTGATEVAQAVADGKDTYIEVRDSSDGERRELASWLVGYCEDQQDGED